MKKGESRAFDGHSGVHLCSQVTVYLTKTGSGGIHEEHSAWRMSGLHNEVGGKSLCMVICLNLCPCLTPKDATTTFPLLGKRYGEYSLNSLSNSERKIPRC